MTIDRSAPAVAPAAAPVLPARMAAVHDVVILTIGAYPLLWLIGLGGLFWPLICLVLVWRTSFAPSTPVSTLLLAIGQLLLLSVPVGVAAFGFEFTRLISVLANVSVWIAISALVRLAAHDPWFRERLVRQLLVLAAVQGAVTAVAFAIYPASLPIPLLHSLKQAMPTGMGAFAASPLVYSDWLDGAAYRSIGMMANPTWAGAVGGLGLMIALTFRNRRRHNGLLRLAAIAGGVFSMQLALSRSVEISLVGALALAVVELARRRLHLSLTPWLAAALAFPLLVVVLAPRVAEWATSVNAEPAGSAESRGAIYQLTYDYIRELPLPLLGYGIKPKADGLVASVASHSTYLGLTSSPRPAAPSSRPGSPMPPPTP